MTIRAVPCPKCRRVPETVATDYGYYRTQCTTVGCKNHLVCLGDTDDASRECWNGRIDARDY